MHVYERIRQLYLPVQPSVKQSADDVVYREVRPAEALQPFIYCYWELRTQRKLDAEFNYRVVADGCIDIFFEPDNPAESYVMGFCKKYTEFPLAHSFHYMGIRFLPAMFPRLFRINAAELSNRFQLLADVVPPIASFIAGGFTPDLDTAARSLDAFFLKAADKISPEADNRLYEAITIILQNSGMVNVETRLDTGISPRQLRRLFGYYIGDTAKTFCRVVRFQHILRAKPSSQSLRQNKLFFGAGYYDQAHFIREFRNFYGVTPSRAFGR